MSDFINYKKRDATLPPGCKNLIDVLQPKELQRTAAGFFGFDPANVRSGKLHDIRRYIDLLIHSNAGTIGLCIAAPDYIFAVTIVSFRLEDSDSRDFDSVTLSVPPDDPREGVLRNFLAKRNLRVTEMSAPLPDSFVPGIPVFPNWVIDPLPRDAPMLAVLITELFREVCGSDESSDLHFELM